MDSSVHDPTAEEVGGWDEDELLDWIQKTRPRLLKGDRLEKFKAAEISGKVFLNHAGDTETFEKKCNLSFGVSETLANIATDIVGMETAGIKRNKKPRWESETDTILQMLAASAHQQRERLEIEKLATSARQQGERTQLEIEKLAASAHQQRERIRLEIEKLDWLPALPPKNVVSPPKGALRSLKGAVPPSKDVVSCPNSVLHLSNPTFDTKLPFPFVGQMIPSRFKVNGKDNESNWFYMGREKFVKLRKEFERVRNSPQHSALTIYGTRGYGKSHLLAAFVCCLAASEEKVVYIPDCREFMKQPIPYIRAAILFAWADDKSEQQTIMALDNQEKIDLFFQGRNGVVFVIDQLNALEEEDGDDGPTIAEKARLRLWLQRLRATGKALLSSSANNHSILNKALKQSSDEVMYAYGGLTENEMKHWWTRRQVELGGYTKDEVEDFTGCIPWFLEKCVVDGTIDLTAEFFTDIYDQAWAFEKRIQTQHYKDTDTLRLHYDYMRDCLFGMPVQPSSKNIPDLVDHRYFYDEHDDKRNRPIGHYTCGICRNAVAPMILENRVRLDKEFALSLPEYVSNPIVTGFMIELAVLSSIALHGLNITSELNLPMGVGFFKDDFPSFNTTKEKPVLYVPTVFNFPNIDGIIVRIAKSRRRKGKQELFMYPLQITLQPDKHSNSRKNFFGAWKKWTKGLQEFDVVPEFLWITPKEPEITEYKRSSECPAHVEQYVPISHVSAETWNWYEEGKRSKQIMNP